MKKILLGLGATLAVVAGVAAMSAYEAHIINVTATIENTLTVPASLIEFGTVFPQEYQESSFNIGLSQSFLDKNQLRKGDVQYKIEQKPKCIDDTTKEHVLCVVNEVGACVCPEGTTPMPDLCRFLSKMCVECDGDVGVPSYYNSGTKTCLEPSSHIATGYLAKCHPDHVICPTGDTVDCWKVDLKVPPVAGSVGQDWPASCASYTVPTDGAEYGCDLWVEVTYISDLEEPPTSPYCGDGWVTEPEQCESNKDCETNEICDGCMCQPLGL